MTTWLPILVIVALMLCVALVRIPLEERALVHRSGQPHRVAGPGWILALPFLERVERLDATRLPEDWEDLSNAEIFERLS